MEDNTHSFGDGSSSNPEKRDEIPQPSLEQKKEFGRSLLRLRGVRRFEALENILPSLRPGERLLLYGLASIMALSVFAIIASINTAVSTVVPAEGGTLVGGETGPVRFINPVLMVSQPDQDLTALVYSGLMRALPKGKVIPDLASSYTTSEDGITYTFTIRDDATFHDGTPVTSADVVFTVRAAQNPEVKSPRRADWEGVEVSAPDDRTVVFKLPHPYAPFIFNSTLGILPKHLWQDTPPEEIPFSPLNTHPVGTGPYQVSKVSLDKTGAATRYELSPFKHFALSGPYLKKISLQFYPNEQAMVDAFNAREISAISGLSPAQVPSLKRSDVQVLRAPLPRVYGIFFNQNRAEVLSDASVRDALNAALDKQAIVDGVLSGYGVPLYGPIPPGVLRISSSIKAQRQAGTSSDARDTTEALSPADKARAILQKGGWKYDEEAGVWKKKSGSGKDAAEKTLSFALSTAGEPELVATANAVAEAWRQIGVQVEVQMYSLSELQTSVIRPRQYDAILFGEVVGREGDFFAFWHSSQRNDPGLNLAMYANAKVDSYLSQARATTDENEREKLYGQFAEAVQKDSAAVFLYAPDFIYVVPREIRGIELGALTTPSERFFNVYDWYTDEKRVWNVFVDPTDQIK